MDLGFLVLKKLLIDTKTLGLGCEADSTFGGNVGKLWKGNGRETEV